MVKKNNKKKKGFGLECGEKKVKSNFTEQAYNTRAIMKTTEIMLCTDSR